jgi:hypothetical protein
MFIEKKFMETWFRKIMERFDGLENRLPAKFPEKKERQTLNGETLLDNTDLCLTLNVSKRTLQRYRSLGWLPYRQIDQKTYYLKSEVEKFIADRFEKRKKLKK